MTSEKTARQLRAIVRAYRTTEKTALENARAAREAGDEATARTYDAMAEQARQKAEQAEG